jgi:hypothetical protein
MNFDLYVTAGDNADRRVVRREFIMNLKRIPSTGEIIQMGDRSAKVTSVVTLIGGVHHGHLIINAHSSDNWLETT